MKIIIEIPEKTSAHIRSDYGHGVKGLRIEDMEMLVDAVYHGEPYHVRPQGKWEYLKEHITEMRDADGELNQKQTCQFILNLMGVVEKEGDPD